MLLGSRKSFYEYKVYINMFKYQREDLIKEAMKYPEDKKILIFKVSGILRSGEQVGSNEQVNEMSSLRQINK